MAQLRADHREVESTLAEVAALVSRPGATVPVPVVHALVAAVAEHERRENALFQEHLATSAAATESVAPRCGQAAGVPGR